MAEVADKTALLGAVDFFKGCTPAQLTDIAQLAEDRHLRAGDELCRQGDFESEVFVLVEGDAAVIFDGNQVATVSSGEVVGELAMQGAGRRSATIRAITPLHVLVMDPREIDSVLASDPSSAHRLGPHRPYD